MRFHVRKVAGAMLAGAIASSSHAQAGGNVAEKTGSAASAAGGSSEPCKPGPDQKVQASAYDELRRLPKEGVEAALQRAYLNTVLTRYEVDYITRQECLTKNAAKAAKEAALNDFAHSGNDPEAAAHALKAIDAERHNQARMSLAEAANDSAIEEFLLLRSAAADPDRTEEAKKLAGLVRPYPEIVNVGNLKKADAVELIGKAHGIADKAQGLAKEVQTYADDSAKIVLAQNTGTNGGSSTETQAKANAKAADDAWTIGRNVSVANRLAKDAQNVSDVTVELALRALKDPEQISSKVDLAEAQNISAQLKYDKDRLDYVRTDALLGSSTRHEQRLVRRSRGLEAA